jgi:hypothetical protein
VTQLVLSLHECADKSIADPVAAESIADPAATESVAEPLQFVANPAAASAAPTETSCLCV